MLARLSSACLTLTRALEVTQDSQSSGDFPWIPIAIQSCSDSCDAFVQCDSASAKDDPAFGGSGAKPYKTIQYAVSRRVPGQTIHVMDGTCALTSTVSLNDVEDLVIKAYDGHSPKVIFSTLAAAFAGSRVKRFRLEGLEIEGPNAQVTYQQAMADRERRVSGEASQISGKGVAIWSGDHIQFSNLKVHHCPGAGLRVNKGDYIVIQDSEVYSNCWWSTSAESAVVFAESTPVDKSDAVKMVMRRNRVYDNLNKVPYYNPQYAWNYSPIKSDCNLDQCNPDSPSFSISGCPWQCRYGKSYQDYVIDGQGVYVTRNSDTYTHGRTWLANNEAFANGINGLVFHRTNNGMIKDNLVYDNGVLPKAVPGDEDWQQHLSKGRQPFAGITINNAEGVTMQGNVVKAPNSNDGAYDMEYDRGSGAPKLSDASTGNAVCLGKAFDNSLGPAGMFEFPQCSDSDKRCCLSLV
jgi:hypothetical protein